MTETTVVDLREPQTARSRRPRIRLGFDVFIAHNRASAAGYSRRLYDSLTSTYGLICNIDVVGFKPGTRLRSQTLLNLLLSHMLIVVFTPEACRSQHVRREVTLFLLLRKWLFWNRPISILDVAGEWKRLVDLPSQSIEKPWEQLREETNKQSLLYETETDFASGPTAKVCARYGEWKTFERLRKRDIRVVGISIATAIVLGGLTIASLFTLNRARTAAVKAEQSRKSAIALKLGAQAERAISLPYGLSVETAVLLAIESMKRETNADAYRAATDGLELLPRPLRTASIRKNDRLGAWLSPNGRHILLDKDDGIEVRNVDSGATVGLIRATKGQVSVVSFSTEGDFVLTREAEGDEVQSRSTRANHTILNVFRLSDVANVGSAQFERRFEGIGALGPKGTAFAVKSGDSVLFGRFSRRGALVSLGAAGYAPFPLFSNDGRFLAVIQTEKGRGQTRIWDIDSLRGTASAPPKPALVIDRGMEVFAAAFSPDGKYLAAAEGTGKIFAVRIFSTEDGSEQTEPFLHPKKVSTVGFSPDGQHLVTEDGEAIRVWTTSGALWRIDQRGDLFPSSQTLTAPVAIRNDGLMVLRWRNEHYLQDDPDEEHPVGDTDIDLYSFDSARSHVVSEVVSEGNLLRIAAVSREGGRVAVGTGTGIVIYALNGSALPVTLTEPAKHVSFSQDGQWLVVVGESSFNQEFAITLIRTQNGQIVWRGTVPAGFDAFASVSNNGTIAVGLELGADDIRDNTFVLDHASNAKRSWALGSAPEEYSPDHPEGWVWPGVPNYRPPLVSISPDGRFLLMDNEVLNARDGTKAATTPADAVGYESHGNRIYLKQGKSFRAWDLTSGAMSGEQFGLGALSGDGELSATVSGKWIWVYRVRDGAPLAQVDFGSEVLSAALSPDGKMIIASGEDARLRTFRWQPDDMVRVAQQFLTRPLNQEERDQYLQGEVPIVTLQVETSRTGSHAQAK
jgi:WD40 repeat protein